ncbi:unnamed protein product [Eruca vesicaria subsp. sativa]|uniref:DUF7812 domain-containing protein n=1 Tax=Eruca vesicaria subsp. sativa TaxID=29727 RepID=A0ABC8JGU7_ERUVS|nr:unnamed protein product [Eruca vesicaria subsp. sativa]
MVATRSSKKLRASKISDPTLFRSLASSLASTQVSKQPLLKHLLCILSKLSSTQPINWDSCDVASHNWNLKSSGEQVESISFVDVCNLSDVLFMELDNSFESLFSTLRKKNAESCYTFASSEEERTELAILYLRCCLKIITLLFPNQDLVLKKAKTLVSVLSGLVSATYGGSSSFVFTHDESRRTFLCTGLEVFIDEVMVNNSIRDLLFLVDPAFSSCILFSKHDWAGVVEMVSAHFILSVSDEKMNEMYVERLYWKQVSPVRPPQLTMSAATSLLLDPTMFSPPRMVHAYVVLLVSDAISSCCVKGLDLQLFDRCIDAFHKSVVLYTLYMIKEENNSSGKVGRSMSSSRMRVTHLLLPSTLEKVNEVTLKLNASWGSYQSNNAKRENDELVACSVAYAKESLSVFESSYPNSMLAQILSVLGCVIRRASSDNVMDSVLQKYSASGVEDLYLLASILKLMSCSLLQAIRVLQHRSEDVGDVRTCKEYKAIMDVVQRFEKFSVHLPGQSFLHDKMESHPHVHTKSKWMLMHFSGLLSVSFALKVDFLMKGSIFGLVVSLYLFIIEGGDVKALGHSESPSPSIPSSDYLEASGKAEETAVDRKLSEAVALRYQKIRTSYLGKLSEAKDAENGSDSEVGVEENSCNGEEFLWCMAGKGNLRSSDVEELADFVVCDPGKDYADWLKGRERFRSQKLRKIDLQRWKKKQKAWRKNKRKNA